jgi:hypothetical protein
MPGGGYGFKGDVAEVIIYDRVITDDERAAVQLYCYLKYNFGLETLTLMPTPGVYSPPVQVTITSPTQGAEIYYTIDGSQPVRGVSPRYTAPITIA